MNPIKSIDDHSLNQRLALAVEGVQQYLREFATSREFIDNMRLAFGESFEAEVALKLAEAWQNQDFSVIPTIEFLSSAQLHGANGAYAAATGRIYLSEEFVRQHQNDLAAIVNLVLEEVGHRIDGLLNTVDSAGDEGAIFAALVRGESLSNEDLRQLRDEDDRATITVNGNLIEVEQSQMIMNPTKAWTRLLGTNSIDRAYALTTGNDGAIYVSGVTTGNLDGQTNVANFGAAFISKYNADGTKVWTRLSDFSDSSETAYALTTGSDGSIYVSGAHNYSVITPGGISSGSYDAFITKYNPDGTKVWTQFLGIIGVDDVAYALTTGDDGAIYVSGRTNGSLDGQTNSGSGDAFISKYNADGTKVWTRLLGSSSYDEAYALTTGSDGAIYVSGVTYSNLDGQSNSGGSDGFISKYNPDGTKVWTQLLGSSGSDYATALTTGTDGTIYVSGVTDGNLDGQSNSGGSDGFISKYNPDGTKVWTQLLGSSGSDYATALTTGTDGTIYVSGWTTGNLDGQTNSGNYNTFISKYNPDGTKVWTQLLATTMGSNVDFSTTLTTGKDGAIYLGGSTEGNLDGQNNSGSQDAFIIKFAEDTNFIGTSGNDSITGTPNSDIIQGLGGNDTLFGLAGNDTLDGGDGNDSLDGGTKDDSLIGGVGNDTYTVDSIGDSILESASAGTDLVKSSVSWVLGANLENLTLIGSSTINATGNSLNNILIGNTATNTLNGVDGNDSLIGGESNDTLFGGSGNDTLFGGLGDDSLIGGIGNDIYTVDSISDSILESVNGGTDLVKSSVSWLLADNLENLTLTGSGAINATGNNLNNIIIGNTGANTLNGVAGNDTLFGGSGNDTLDGGVGIDSLIGGVGDDIYTVDNLSDTITEGLNGGTDLVKSSVSWLLADNLENLTLTGSGAINATGNNLNNIIIGNTGANTLNGVAGNDTLFGGSGNDTLDGGVGIDSLIGGVGDDIYTVDNLSDTITEGLNGGTDLVKSSVSWLLADNLENLTLTGSGAINATGNNLNNIIIGNTGANTLNGVAGNDTLFGGSGNDTLFGGLGDDSLIGGIGNDIYTVDSISDSILESVNGGTDLVKSSVSWLLADNLENLTMTGSGAINATGNNLNNIIIGNTGANTLNGVAGNDSLIGSSGNDTLFGGDGNDSLDGGVGIDSLIGGVGNDIYIVDNLIDTITEGLDAGTDLVKSSVSWVLGNNLENLTLIGTGAINGTGNSQNNVLTGNTGVNTLNGVDGNDSLIGGTGNDTLFGGAGDDLLSGGTGKDVLTGGIGRDSLYLTDTRTGGYDIIADFTVGDDRIFLSKAEFGLSQSQNTSLEASLFRLGASAATASDRFIYNQTTGNLFFDKDGVGGTAQVQIAQFSNQAMLTNANITVIA